MNTVKNVDDPIPTDGPPGAEGPPRGVATMSIVRWVLVLLAGILAAASLLHFSGVHLGGGKGE